MAYPEQLPGECPNDHPLNGPGKDVNVGWLPCGCAYEGREVEAAAPSPAGTCEPRMTWYNPPHDERDWIPGDELRVPPVR